MRLRPYSLLPLLFAVACASAGDPVDAGSAPVSSDGGSDQVPDGGAAPDAGTPGTDSDGGLPVGAPPRYTLEERGRICAKFTGCAPALHDEIGNCVASLTSVDNSPQEYVTWESDVLPFVHAHGRCILAAADCDGVVACLDGGKATRCDELIACVKADSDDPACAALAPEKTFDCDGDSISVCTSSSHSGQRYYFSTALPCDLYGLRCGVTISGQPVCHAGTCAVGEERCDGDVGRECHGRFFRSKDCAARDATCSIYERFGDTHLKCEPNTTPCDAAPVGYSCDGNTLLRCDSGDALLSRTDCELDGQRCSPAANTIGSRCAHPAGDTTCAAGALTVPTYGGPLVIPCTELGFAGCGVVGDEVLCTE